MSTTESLRNSSGDSSGHGGSYATVASAETGLGGAGQIDQSLSATEAIAGPSPLPESSSTAILFRLSDIRGFTQHLTGRLKTLIDGAVADPTQRKALKDLIHAMTWEEHYGAMMTWANMVVERQATGQIYVSPPFTSVTQNPPDAP